MCREAGGTDADCVATATALTAESVVGAYRGFVVPHFEAAGLGKKTEICVAGGGAKNGTLMGMLREGFAEMGVRMRAR
jgi:anhydro-N-acetylmuramic acid kinase